MKTLTVIAVLSMLYMNTAEAGRFGGLTKALKNTDVPPTGAIHGVKSTIPNSTERKHVDPPPISIGEITGIIMLYGFVFFAYRAFHSKEPYDKPERPVHIPKSEVTKHLWKE